mmetsp:Transcript_5409/g.13557  ORF Transcript_5409/g.13557 Transcript_5409/m.13557 type:complete len:98 (-) Transcript_5409:1395-1688(-)
MRSNACKTFARNTMRRSKQWITNEPRVGRLRDKCAVFLLLIRLIRVKIRIDRAYQKLHRFLGNLVRVLRVSRKSVSSIATRLDGIQKYFLQASAACL